MWCHGLPQNQRGKLNAIFTARKGPQGAEQMHVQPCSFVAPMVSCSKVAIATIFYYMLAHCLFTIQRAFACIFTTLPNTMQEQEVVPSLG